MPKQGREQPKAGPTNTVRHAACGAVRLGFAWLVVLMVAPAQAQVPACVDLWLPARLPARESWRRMLLQETKPLLSNDSSAAVDDRAGGGCAQLYVLQENGERGALTLRVMWLGKSRAASLLLTDTAAFERPRAGALLARGLLQQFVHDSLAPSHDETADQVSTPASSAKSGTAPATPTPVSAAAQGRGAPIERAPLHAKRPKQPAQPTPPKLPTPARPQARPEPALAAAEARADREAEEPAPRRVRSSAWSGSALTGSALVLNSFSALLRFELGVRYSFLSQRMRIGLALLAETAVPRMSDYPLMKLGGPGARVGFDLLLTDAVRRRFWLGLGANAVELILEQQSVDPSTIPVGQRVPTVRSYHTAVNVDMRFSIEIALSRRSYFLIALQLAYGLRELEGHPDAERVPGFAGVMAGLHLGAGF